MVGKMNLLEIVEIKPIIKSFYKIDMEV